jgi:polysaccharide pyruvyl transferase WcaK-like protein
MMNRRSFLQSTALSVAAVCMQNVIAQAAAGKSNPVILIVSGFQAVNIGDIAQAPGLVQLLYKKIPNAKLILCKSRYEEGVNEMMQANFPSLQIINGGVGADLNLSAVLKTAFDEADICIHGSAPYIVGEKYMHAWIKHTRKPYGAFGITVMNLSETNKNIYQNASFIFTRETKSIEVLKNEGIQGKHIFFAPDATFFLNISDDVKANKSLNELGLTEKEFICVIPRLRNTPYYKIAPNPKVHTEENIKLVNETNNKYKELDHAKLREAMIMWVRKTGHKVLVCPEMTYQVDIMDELLIDPLPEDVKSKVVKRGYWLPDEAASVYKKAFALLSFECHSPIISLANGTTAFYLRQPSDTIKGQMYYDLKLGDWCFEIDATKGSDISARLQELIENPTRATKKVRRTQKDIDSIYTKAVKKVKSSIS